MPKLTYDTLVKAGACKQREDYHRVAGEGIELTDAIAAQYAEAFDIDFSIMNLLTTHNMYRCYREIAKGAKNFTSSTCREFKVFRAVTAARIYREQLALDEEYGPIT